MLDTRAVRTIIGTRKDGRPIYLIQGGADEGGQGGGGDGGQGGEGDKGGAGDQDGKTGGQQQTPGPFDHITDPAELRALAVRLTNEAASAGGRNREAARAAAANEAREKVTQDIAKALGLTSDAKDPADLERQVEQLTKANTERDRELAIYRAALAPGMNANVGRLMDSRSFMREMEKVDPNADDAHEQITQGIKNALSSDQSLRAAQVSGGGSVGHAGGAGDHTNPDLSKLHGTSLMEAAYAANSSKGS